MIIIIIKNNNKPKVVKSAYLSRNKKKTKKAGYIIPNMNCYPRNGQLKDLDFTRHILHHPNQQQYLQHPFSWFALSISTIVLRTTRNSRLQYKIKNCLQKLWHNPSFPSFNVDFLSFRPVRYTRQPSEQFQAIFTLSTLNRGEWGICKYIF